MGKTRSTSLVWHSTLGMTKARNRRRKKQKILRYQTTPTWKKKTRNDFWMRQRFMNDLGMRSTKRNEPNRTANKIGLTRPYLMKLINGAKQPFQVLPSRPS